MPVRAALLPTGPHLRLYRRLRFGSLIDFNVLDTRQYRSDQVCGSAIAGCPDAHNPTRTILGAEQEKWLFRNLATSRAKWTVIGQQVPTFVRDASTNPTGTLMDKWDGYVVSRQRLYRHLHEAKTPNPIVLSGDVHTHWGADLKMDFANPKSETVGVEFTNTSITSGGDGRDTAADWDRIRSSNPHLLYHSARRGYIACTVSPATMRADFKTVDSVSTPGASATLGGTLVVEAGHAGGSRA
jgi:alkaline phosphatase D